MTSRHHVAVVGCGSISNAWIKSALSRPDVEIVALADLDESAARKKAADYHLPNALVTTDLGAALKQTSPDVLFNCTIPEAHEPTTVLALKQGCHVLCEKPLAHTMAGAREMIRTAKDAGRILAVMQNRRFDPNIRRVRAFLDSGALGPINAVESNFFIGAHFAGFRGTMKHVLVFDMAVHTFDAARFLTRANPTLVYCTEWNPAGSWYEHDASAVAIFEMTGGIRYVYHGSWCAEGHATKWESQWRIIGQKGTLLWDGGTSMNAQAVTKTGGFISEVANVPVPPLESDSGQSGHAGLINDFLDCLDAGRTPETTAEDNIHTLAMVHEAIASSETGRPSEIHFQEM